MALKGATAEYFAITMYFLRERILLRCSGFDALGAAIYLDREKPVSKPKHEQQRKARPLRIKKTPLFKTRFLLAGAWISTKLQLYSAKNGNRREVSWKHRVRIRAKNYATFTIPI